MPLSEILILFATAALVIWLIIRNAPKLGLIDMPNGRSVHKHATPRGAGIGIYLAVALFFPLFHFELFGSYFWSLAAIFLVFVVGVLDDHRDTAPRTKFVVITIATVIVYFDGLTFTSLKTFFGVEVPLGVLALPFTLFATVGFTNAFNLIDGLDGLAGTIGLVILATLYYLGYRYDDPFVMVVAGSFIVTLLAFLLFNWNPARVFMGDSGSLTLGFVISVLVIKLTAYIQPVAVFYLVALPVLDTLIVMIRRKRRGRSMVSPDRTHIHHIFLALFQYDVKKTVLFLGAVQAVYGYTALGLCEGAEQSYSLLFFILNFFILYVLLSAILKRQELLQVEIRRTGEQP